MEYYYQLRGILIGDQGVGKTTLLNRLSKNCFVPDEPPTIGLDLQYFYEDFRENSKFGVHIRPVRVCVTDASGQARFREIRNSYFDKQQFACVCFSMCDEESFLNVLKHVDHAASKVSKILVVATNMDRATMSKQRVCQLFDRFDVHFVSNKTGSGISELKRAMMAVLGDLPDEKMIVGPLHPSYRSVSLEIEQRRSKCC